MTNTDRTARMAREDQAMAELDRYAREAREAGKTARLGALFVVVILMAALWAGFMAPVPEANSAPRPTATRVSGEVDVCVLKADLGRSWTRGLERKANRRYVQRIDVQRRAEDRLGGCDVVVWAGGKVAEDYVAGTPAPNPRYHVYTGEYAMVAGEVNVGTSTPRKQRQATMLAALQALHTAGVFR